MCEWCGKEEAVWPVEVIDPLTSKKTIIKIGEACEMQGIGMSNGC